MGVAYTNLHLSVEFNQLIYLLTYLPTYLLNLSQHCVRNVIRHLHFCVCAAIALQKSARLLQHLFYNIAQNHNLTVASDHRSMPLSKQH